jgi:dihydroneopterin aldolase
MTERRKLINEYAKRIMKRLKEEYPKFEWYLTLRNDKEVMIGTLEGRAIVIGSTYEDIVNSLALNDSIEL